MKAGVFLITELGTVISTPLPGLSNPDSYNGDESTMRVKIQNVDYDLQHIENCEHKVPGTNQPFEYCFEYNGMTLYVVLQKQ